MRIDFVIGIDPVLTSFLRSAFLTIGAKLDLVSQKVDHLIAIGESAEMDLTAITTAVSKNTDAIGSAKQALQGIADQIRQNTGDQAALNKLADALTNDDAGLAAAILAGTTPPVPAPAAA